MKRIEFKKEDWPYWFKASGLVKEIKTLPFGFDVVFESNGESYVYFVKSIDGIKIGKINYFEEKTEGWFNGGKVFEINA